MDDRKENPALLARQKRQLKRLEVVIDVVYAVVIWRVFMLLPRPAEEDMVWRSLDNYLLANAGMLVLVILAIVIVIIYWIQNNALFGNLERTDTIHTSISILQIFFLLMFLFAIRLGVTYEGTVIAKVFESSTAAIVGLASWMGWRYAIKDRRLLIPELSTEEAEALAERIKAEPATAMITIPCAFIGPIAWELAWFSYPLFVKVFGGVKSAVNKLRKQST